MLKKYNNINLKFSNSKDNTEKLKIDLFRFSFFYSLLKLRKKTYITLKDYTNKFKLIKVIKKKKYINNLIFKTLSYNNFDKVATTYDYSINNPTNFIQNNNVKWFYEKKKKYKQKNYIEFFNNTYIKSKLFYRVYSGKFGDSLYYHNKFWFLNFLFNFKTLNLKFFDNCLKASLEYNKNYFANFYKNLQGSCIIKFLLCINRYYFLYLNHNEVNICNKFSNYYIFNCNHKNIFNYTKYSNVLVNNKNFNMKAKKEAYFWTLYLMKKKKWKTNYVYPLFLEFLKDLIERQFKRNVVLNMVNIKKIKYLNYKYNIKYNVIDNKEQHTSYFSDYRLNNYWNYFSNFLKKWYIFKDLLISKTNKYNIYVLKKYFFFIKVIKASLLKLFNCFKFIWNFFNKKKFNIINILKIFIFFNFYKNFIKFKKSWKSKKLSFIFKKPVLKINNKLKMFKRNKKNNDKDKTPAPVSIKTKKVSKFYYFKKRLIKESVTNKLNLLSLYKKKKNKLSKLKIIKRIYYRYNTSIHHFKLNQKRIKELKLQRKQKQLKMQKIKKLRYLKMLKYKAILTKLKLKAKLELKKKKLKKNVKVL